MKALWFWHDFDTWQVVKRGKGKWELLRWLENDSTWCSFGYYRTRKSAVAVFKEMPNE